MNLINGAQIRGARGLLNWTQDNLAETCNLSRRTVQLIENDHPVRMTNIRKIQDTFKDHGVEFLNDHGVKLQAKDIRVFKGPDSCDDFLDYVLETLNQNGDSFCCIIPQQAMLTYSSGSAGKTNIDRLEHIQKIVPVKCLLTDGMAADFVEPNFEVRALPGDQLLLPTAFFSFGRVQAMGFFDKGRINMSFVLIYEYAAEQIEHGYFFPYWKVAKPVKCQPKAKKRRA